MRKEGRVVGAAIALECLEAVVIQSFHHVVLAPSHLRDWDDAEVRRHRLDGPKDATTELRAGDIDRMA
jgi:hypothetical protein